jgi:exodeoxyribonuclease-3
MRVLTFNANGLRSAVSKGFFDWFTGLDVDVLCVQETKAQEHQLGDAAFRPAGYQAWFKDACTRKGYSGVAIYSRRSPDEIRTELGWAPFDDEGRYIEARFGTLSVVSLYLPSGSSGPLRQQFKEQVMAWLKPILESWLTSGREYVVCGDWNIVRSQRDIKNWASNQKNSGCLPHERAWLNGLIADPHHDGLIIPPTQGWKDAFRVARPDDVAYTWWSQRGNARANDVGWRIDYQLCTPAIAATIRDAVIYPQPKFSDHAPMLVEYVR